MDASQAYMTHGSLASFPNTAQPLHKPQVRTTKARAEAGDIGAAIQLGWSIERIFAMADAQKAAGSATQDAAGDVNNPAHLSDTEIVDRLQHRKELQSKVQRERRVRMTERANQGDAAAMKWLKLSKARIAQIKQDLQDKQQDPQGSATATTDNNPDQMTAEDADADADADMSDEGGANSGAASPERVARQKRKAGESVAVPNIQYDSFGQYVTRLADNTEGAGGRASVVHPALEPTGYDGGQPTSGLRRPNSILAVKLREDAPVVGVGVSSNNNVHGNVQTPKTRRTMGSALLDKSTLGTAHTRQTQQLRGGGTPTYQAANNQMQSPGQHQPAAAQPGSQYQAPQVQGVDVVAPRLHQYPGVGGLVPGFPQLPSVGMAPPGSPQQPQGYGSMYQLRVALMADYQRAHEESLQLQQEMNQKQEELGALQQACLRKTQECVQLELALGWRFDSPF